MNIVELYARLYTHRYTHPALHLARYILVKAGVRAARRPSERIVEYPWVLQNLDLEQGRILDIGCGQSRLPIELASLGYDVYGIDILKTDLEHPNFNFYLGDGRHMPFANSCVDRVIAVSTIEHIGLSVYEKETVDIDGDKKVMEEIARILKPQGKVLLTVPYGKRCVTPQGRVYDDDELKRLLALFTIEVADYFIENRYCWMPAPATKLLSVDSKKIVRGVVCIKGAKAADALDSQVPAPNARATIYEVKRCPLR